MDTVDLGVGTLLGTYRVEGKLGQGGMAKVYLVRHSHLDSLHAMKILDSRSAHVRDRLFQEGRLQASLHHPNIVSVTDVVVIDGCPALVMEYVDGAPLDELLASKRLEMYEVDALVLGILAGVGAAHARGLIHRDLKPANVLLARHHGGVTAKVADFGLAKIVLDRDSTGQTKSGQIMGTPCYMAPEQVRDTRGVDQRADIFSLGAMFYEMVSGTRCFPGESMYDVLLRIGAGHYVPLRELVPDVPARVEVAIDAALSVDREARPPDCQALLRLWTGGQDRSRFRSVSPAVLQGLGRERPPDPAPNPGRGSGGSATFDLAERPPEPDSVTDPLLPVSPAPLVSPLLVAPSPVAPPVPAFKWAAWFALAGWPALLPFVPAIRAWACSVAGLSEAAFPMWSLVWVLAVAVAAVWHSLTWSHARPTLGTLRDGSLALLCMFLAALGYAQTRCTSTLENLTSDLRAYADLSQQPLLPAHIGTTIGQYMSTAAGLSVLMICWCWWVMLACAFHRTAPRGDRWARRAFAAGVSAILASVVVQRLLPGEVALVLLGFELPGGLATAITLARCTAELPATPDSPLRRDLPRITLVVSTCAAMAAIAVSITFDYVARLGEIGVAPPQLRAALSAAMALSIQTHALAGAATLLLAIAVYAVIFRRALLWPAGVLGARDALATGLLCCGVLAFPASLLANLRQFGELSTGFNVIGGMLPTGQAYVDVAPRTFGDLDSAPVLAALDGRTHDLYVAPPAEAVAQALAARSPCLAAAVGTGGLSAFAATCITPALAATVCAAEGARLPTPRELVFPGGDATYTADPLPASARARAQAGHTFLRATGKEWGAEVRDGGIAYFRVDLTGKSPPEPVPATVDGADVEFRCAYDFGPAK